MEQSFADQIINSLDDDSWPRTWQTNRLTLLVRDPTSIFAYWEINDQRKRLLCEHFQRSWESFPMFIRLHDVTDIIFDGYNAHLTRTVGIHHKADNWYFHDLKPGRRYIADITTLNSQDKFFTIIRSSVVGTPPRYLNNNSQPKIRFAKPNSNTVTKSEKVVGQQSAGNWRIQFTGYNLVE